MSFFSAVLQGRVILELCDFFVFVLFCFLFSLFSLEERHVDSWIELEKDDL